MLARDLPHQGHDEQVVVVGQVTLLIDGRELELVGRDLVVAGLERDAQAERLDLQLFHELEDAGRDGTEVVILELLVFRALMPHQRAARHQEIRARGIQPLVDQEIFLLPAQIGVNLLDVGVEIVANVGRRLVDRLERLQERRLVVERLARIGDEDGRDAERVADDEGGRRGIPGRVAPGLEGVADATVREARRVGFLLDQQLATEFLDDAALAVVLDEGVMLLGRALRQGVEPVRVVRGAFLEGPFLHTRRDGVGCLPVEGRTIIDRVDQALERLSRKILEHLLAVEDQLAEIVGRPFLRSGYLDRFSLEGRLDNPKS